MTKKRFDIVDGLRGYLLFGMMISHLHLVGAPLVGYAHHRWLLGFWDAEFFVALSGLMCGIVALRNFGIGPELRAFLVSKMKLLYLYIVGLQLTIGTIETGRLPDPGELGAILMLDGRSSLSATLDLYFWCFVFLALTIAIFGKVWQMLVVAMVIYIFAVAYPQRGMLGFGSSNFNVLTWNLLFVSGFAAGVSFDQITQFFDRHRGRLNLPRILALAILWLVARILLDPIAPFVLPSHVAFARDMLMPAQLLNVTLFASLFLIVLRFDPSAFPARQVTFALTHPLFLSLGRLSIQAFAFHALLISLYSALRDPANPAGDVLLALAALATFLMFPRLHAQWRTSLRLLMSTAGKINPPMYR